MDKDVSYLGIFVKSLKVLYIVLGYLPAVWAISFLALILAASAKLGGIPHYPQSPGPASVGLESYAYMTMMVGVMALLSVIVWPVLTLVLFLLPYRKEVITRQPFILFLVGASAYWIFKLWLTDVFMWVAN